jgi:hypothetical protein
MNEDGAGAVSDGAGVEAGRVGAGGVGMVDEEEEGADREEGEQESCRRADACCFNCCSIRAETRPRERGDRPMRAHAERARTGSMIDTMLVVVSYSVGCNCNNDQNVWSCRYLDEVTPRSGALHFRFRGDGRMKIQKIT